MTPVKLSVIASVPNVRTLGSGEGRRPLVTPARRCGALLRRFGAAIGGPCAGSSTSPGQVPASSSARSPAEVNPLARALRWRSGPSDDCRGRPCGNALAGQPEGWPLFKDEHMQRMRRCRGEPHPHLHLSSPSMPTWGSAPATGLGIRSPQRREAIVDLRLLVEFLVATAALSGYVGDGAQNEPRLTR